MDYVSPECMIILPNDGARCQHTMVLILFSCCISAERSTVMSCPCVASRSAANTSATAACMQRQVQRRRSAIICELEEHAQWNGTLCKCGLGCRSTIQ